MALKSLSRISKSLRTGAVIAGFLAIIASILAWKQVEVERRIDTEDIDRRARGLIHQLSFSIQEAQQRNDADARQSLRLRLEGQNRLIGCAVYLPDGRPLVIAKSATDFTGRMEAIVAQVIRDGREITETVRSEGPATRFMVAPLQDDAGTTTSIVVILHNVSYIDERTTSRLVQFIFWILLLTLVLSTLIVGVTWLSYDRPLENLAHWMMRLRTENSAEAPPRGLPHGLLSSETNRLAASFRAARATNLDEARSLVRNEKTWTRERLRAHATECLGGDFQLVVVSNREPYMHVMRDGQPQVIVPPGGLVTALDPVLRSCGGLWVAVGNGDADRQFSDANGRIIVPPDDGRYTLRRIWLTAEEDHVYSCCNNEAIWPLCLLAHERPVFRTSDWETYVQINRRFADTVIEEIGPGRAVVLVQDYQLALVPQFLKESRPDLRVGLFWHIPWPNAEAVSICPWRADLVRGMLGADLIGFHLPQFGNNFLRTVDRILETRIDRDHMSVEFQRRTSLIRSFPISIQDWSERGVPSGQELSTQIDEIQREHGLTGTQIVVGVDRIDYTKGLPERFRAFAHFLQKYPQHRGKVTLVQLGAPSRLHLRRYREHLEELKSLVQSINLQFQAGDWIPIRFLVGQHDSLVVHAFLNMASVAIVSSLHDGMNLVAKEYVAAQYAGSGVLVLSEFAGAARDMPEALIINPYDTEQFADAIRYAVVMPKDERQARMEKLRRKVEENNIYRWAADFLSALAACEITTGPRDAVEKSASASTTMRPVPTASREHAP